MSENVIESSVQDKRANYWQNTVFRMASHYDAVPQWWSPQRDAYFRKYWYEENFLASAIYAIANRNAAFGWELKGIEDDVQYAQQMLQFADFGEGWQSFITKFTVDYLTQDNGAFFEVIRPAKVRIDGQYYPAVKECYENDFEQWYAFKDDKRIALRDKSYIVSDTPMDLPIGIAHLDSGQCQRTGDPDKPVIYTDRYGKKHILKWWQVRAANEMPSPIEKMNGVGYSALTRVFRASHIMQSISVYNDEKIGGQFNRAVFLTNVDPEAINDAIAMANEDKVNSGLVRYSQPIVAATLRPEANVSLETINLAEIPDGFNMDTMQNWYIANLALALGVDYGFLAPLPGKGLGTASQSETMQRQAKGKSSRLFMNALSDAFNFRGVLPPSVQFDFVEKDREEEEQVEKTKKARADRFAIYIENGMISPSIASQMAADNGDIPVEYLKLMGQEDMTPAVQVEGDQNIEAEQEVEEHIDDENAKEYAQRKVKNLAQIQKTESLFERPSLFKRAKNVARQAFKTKQVEVPQTKFPELNLALSQYGDELEQLALQAQSGEIEKSEFISELQSSVESALLTIYSEMSGLEPEEFTEQDLENLEEYIAVNFDSVNKLANDIYDGKYDDTEDRDGIILLFGRLGLWTANAAALAMLALLNNPERQQNKLQWVLNPTKENCATCIALDGQVHTVQEWDASGWYPRHPDLECGGWRCGCNFVEVSPDTPNTGNFA